MNRIEIVGACDGDIDDNTVRREWIEVVGISEGLLLGASTKLMMHLSEGAKMRVFDTLASVWSG